MWNIASRTALFAIGLALPNIASAAEITHRKLNDTTEVIRIEGDIRPGDVERFRQISLRHPKAVVELNSNGGSVIPAIEIGKTLRIAGYGTSVPQGEVCASACALIWLAGSPRLLVGQVGFHAAYKDNEGRLQESGAGNALVGNYLTLLGLPAKAVLFATAAPPNHILWLTSANKAEAGIDYISPPPISAASTQRQATVVSPPRVSAAPQKAVKILDVTYAKDSDGEEYGWYKFNYLGIKIEMVSYNISDPEDGLKDKVDRNIKKYKGYIMYATSSDNKLGKLIIYSIHIPSIKRDKNYIDLWQKEEGDFNKNIIYREKVTLTRIFCESRMISFFEEYFYDKSGNEIDRKRYSSTPQRIIPETVDESLWEAVCDG